MKDNDSRDAARRCSLRSGRPNQGIRTRSALLGSSSADVPHRSPLVGWLEKAPKFTPLRSKGNRAGRSVAVWRVLLQRLLIEARGSDLQIAIRRSLPHKVLFLDEFQDELIGLAADRG